MQGNWILRFPTTEYILQERQALAHGRSGEIAGMQHVFSRGFLVSAPPTIIANLPDRAGWTRRSMRFPRTAIRLNSIAPFRSLSQFSVISRLPSLNVLVKVIYAGAFWLSALHRRIDLGPMQPKSICIYRSLLWESFVWFRNIALLSSPPRDSCSETLIKNRCCVLSECPFRHSLSVSECPVLHFRPSLASLVITIRFVSVSVGTMDEENDGSTQVRCAPTHGAAWTIVTASYSVLSSLTPYASFFLLRRASR